MTQQLSAVRAARASPKALDKLRKAAAERYRRGRITAAARAQGELVAKAGPQASRDDWALLGLYHFSAGMQQRAAEIMEAALARFPDDREMLANLGIAHLRARQYDKAELWLARAVSQAPRDANLHDGLARLYMEKGERALAIEHGERALELKDEAATGQRHPAHDLTMVPVPVFDGARPERNIIAFSLWGSAPRYLDGAIKNAGLAPHIYPGWTARFYCDETVPAAALGRLMALGAQVHQMPRQGTLYAGLFWRFGPAFDQAVERYLVRDADSVISLRERLAVEAWIASRRHFHVMRDFLTHTDPMLAGLWGGVRGAVPPDLRQEVKAYLDDPGKTANADQKFLRERLWPVARAGTLIHDSNFKVLGAVPFLSKARLAAMQRGSAMLAAMLRF